PTQEGVPSEPGRHEHRVPEAGHREELGHPLEESYHDGLEERHETLRTREVNGWASGARRQRTRRPYEDVGEGALRPREGPGKAWPSNGRNGNRPLPCGPVDRARTLLGEDDPGIASGLARALSHEGYQVDVTASGVEAVRAVSTGTEGPDLVLLDLGL